MAKQTDSERLEQARADAEYAYLRGPNEDWIKTRSWDIWRHFEDAPSRLVETIDDLLSFLRVPDDAAASTKRAAVEKFLALPAAQAMPERLRRELKTEGYEL